MFFRGLRWKFPKKWNREFSREYRELCRRIREGEPCIREAGLELSKTEQVFLFSSIKWVGYADQTLECKFRRLGAVENRGLNLR